MTATSHLYDPLDPVYFDTADARAKRDRTFQICSDCRICVRLCPSFKDLFRMIDERDDGAHDVRFLRDDQHRRVVDERYQCKLCYVVCPYTPDQGQAWKVDFPRLMLRSAAVNARDVLKREAPDFLGTDEARLIAERTVDVSEWLLDRHRETPFSTDIPGHTYDTIAWHAACQYRAQQIGPKSADLMALTGATISLVERCSAIDGTWGLRAENVELSRRIAKTLMDAVADAPTTLVAGDCHLANTAIREATPKSPVHLVQVLAQAYGLEEE